MDFAFNQEQEAFRREVQEFIKKEFQSEWRHVKGFFELLCVSKEDWKIHVAMAKKFGEKGWLSLAWPKEYGGRNSPILQNIFTEELAYNECPGYDIFGVGMIAPTLLIYGSEEQKRTFLPPIGRGEIMWCQGLSEPDAGSDLASLKTTAVKDGDYYVLNGQKVWTSGAHLADWGLVLVRTDPNTPVKHRGLSFFFVDMKTPGITIHTLRNIANEYEFNEVFFDGVRVPKENLVGGENKGWYVTMALLNFERSDMPVPAIARRNLDYLLDYARQKKSLDPVIRRRLAEMVVECEIARLIHFRSIWMMEKGTVPVWESAMNKAYSLELAQRVDALGMQLLGDYSGLVEGSKWAPWNGRWPYLYLRAIGHTLEMGSSEVDRILLSQTGLGLPR